MENAMSAITSASVISCDHMVGSGIRGMGKPLGMSPIVFISKLESKSAR